MPSQQTVCAAVQLLVPVALLVVAGGSCVTLVVMTGFVLEDFLVDVGFLLEVFLVEVGFFVLVLFVVAGMVLGQGGGCGLEAVLQTS
jgi:hypothetical protein